MKSAHQTTNGREFSARERFNWGYWDGRADHVSGNVPRWKSRYCDTPHPLDASYGKGYYAGLADSSGAESSDAAWNDRAKGNGRKARINRPMFG
jgi:hypothetical protein